MLWIYEWSAILGRDLSAMRHRDSCVNVQESVTVRENNNAMAWMWGAGHSE